MTRTPCPTIRTALLILAALGATADAARAQLMSKWGHPVFTVGATPYDSINQGHGTYPGSPGFIPGYGYYPGPGPDHYPWMDGPGSPFDRRTLVTPGPPAPALPPPGSGPEAPPPGSAVLIVRIPDDAALDIDGTPTSQTGDFRRFVTPRLPPEWHLVYTLRVRWRIQGAELTRMEHVPVAADRVVGVNFLTVDGWSGRRLEPEEQLPPPRPASR